MKRLIPLLIGLCVVAPVLVEAATLFPGHLWSRRTGAGLNDSGTLCIDHQHDIFVSGTCSDSAFVDKYNVNGTRLWHRAWQYDGYGLAPVARNLAVATGGAGIVATVGYKIEDTVFENTYDIQLRSYNSSGSLMWEWYSDPDGYYQEARAVAVDGSGNVIVTGYFDGSVSFGGDLLVSAGSADIFLVKFDMNGNHVWSQRFGGLSGDVGDAVGIDASSSIVFAGTFNGTVGFGGGPLVSTGSSDIFLAKYDANGTHIWSERFGGVDVESPRSLAVDDFQGFALTGNFRGTVNFGGEDLDSAGQEDVFLVKFNSTGAHLWSRSFGGVASDGAACVAMDASGDVLLTGFFNQSISLGGEELVSAGQRDIFIARYDATGAHQWSQRLGGVSSDEGQGIAADGLTEAVVAGSFGGTVDFGGGGLASAGGLDVFVARYSDFQEEPAITTISDVGNDQGSKVLIEFGRSGRDTPTAQFSITQYEAYRRIDPPPSGTALVCKPGDRELLAGGWVQVGFVAAHGEDSYGMVVPTIGDSTVALGPYYSTFFIRAATGDPGVFYDSPPDSGYSLDNLAPGVPGGLLYDTGMLTWNESGAGDFDYFTVYGSSTQSFGSATLVDYCVAPTMDVTSAGYVFYFVTATDFSGNEGAAAMINTASGVGGTPKNYVLSISAYPNPFNPSTTVRYTLPARGRVTVVVYDARGARVATLVDADQDAGAYTERWDGRDGAGRTMSSGVYFVRVDHPAGTKAYKMVLLK